MKKIVSINLSKLSIEDHTLIQDFIGLSHINHTAVDRLIKTVSGKNLVILVGKTGSGKSLIGNILTGLDYTPRGSSFDAEPECTGREIFKTSNQSQSVTQFPQIAANGDGILIMDTPGFEDTESRGKDLFTATVLTDVAQFSKTTQVVLAVAPEALQGRLPITAEINALLSGCSPEECETILRNLSIVVQDPSPGDIARFKSTVKQSQRKPIARAAVAVPEPASSGNFLLSWGSSLIDMFTGSTASTPPLLSGIDPMPEQEADPENARLYWLSWFLDHGGKITGLRLSDSESIRALRTSISSPIPHKNPIVFRPSTKGLTEQLIRIRSVLIEGLDRNIHEFQTLLVEQHNLKYALHSSKAVMSRNKGILEKQPGKDNQLGVNVKKLESDLQTAQSNLAEEKSELAKIELAIENTDHDFMTKIINAEGLNAGFPLPQFKRESVIRFIDQDSKKEYPILLNTLETFRVYKRGLVFSRKVVKEEIARYIQSNETYTKRDKTTDQLVKLYLKDTLSIFDYRDWDIYVTADARVRDSTPTGITNYTKLLKNREDKEADIVKQEAEIGKLAKSLQEAKIELETAKDNAINEAALLKQITLTIAELKEDQEKRVDDIKTKEQALAALKNKIREFQKEASVGILSKRLSFLRLTHTVGEFRFSEHAFDRLQIGYLMTYGFNKDTCFPHTEDGLNRAIIAAILAKNGFHKDQLAEILGLFSIEFTPQEFYSFAQHLNRNWTCGRAIDMFLKTRSISQENPMLFGESFGKDCKFPLFEPSIPIKDRQAAFIKLAKKFRLNVTILHYGTEEHFDFCADTANPDEHAMIEIHEKGIMLHLLPRLRQKPIEADPRKPAVLKEVATHEAATYLALPENVASAFHKHHGPNWKLTNLDGAGQNCLINGLLQGLGIDLDPDRVRSAAEIGPGQIYEEEIPILLNAIQDLSGKDVGNAHITVYGLQTAIRDDAATVLTLPPSHYGNTTSPTQEIHLVLASSLRQTADGQAEPIGHFYLATPTSTPQSRETSAFFPGSHGLTPEITGLLSVAETPLRDPYDYHEHAKEKTPRPGHILVGLPVGHTLAETVPFGNDTLYYEDLSNPLRRRWVQIDPSTAKATEKDARAQDSITVSKEECAYALSILYLSGEQSGLFEASSYWHCEDGVLMCIVRNLAPSPSATKRKHITFSEAE